MVYRFLHSQTPSSGHLAKTVPASFQKNETAADGLAVSLVNKNPLPVSPAREAGYHFLVGCGYRCQEMALPLPYPRRSSEVTAEAGILACSRRQWGAYSCGTAPDSHRLPLLCPRIRAAGHLYG